MNHTSDAYRESLDLSLALIIVNNDEIYIIACIISRFVFVNIAIEAWKLRERMVIS